MKLHLGCGRRLRDEYVNVDINPRLPGVRKVDLNVLPWPWKSNTVEEIFAQDILEHLYPLGKVEAQFNIVAVMEEIWRVLKVGGLLHAIIPTTEGRGAWQDPTHVTFWNANTLSYFVKGQAPAEFCDYRAAFEQAEPIAYRINEEASIVWMEVKLRKVLK